MPKSGIEKQVCPCGSGIVPHVAASVTCRSLHVEERVVSAMTTIYVCSQCIDTLKRATRPRELAGFLHFANPIVTHALLRHAGQSIVAVWDEIREQVPE